MVSRTAGRPLSAKQLDHGPAWMHYNLQKPQSAKDETLIHGQQNGRKEGTDLTSTPHSDHPCDVHRLAPQPSIRKGAFDRQNQRKTCSPENLR